MSYDTTAEPITIGYLMDFTLLPGFPEEMKADFTRRKSMTRRGITKRTVRREPTGSGSCPPGRAGCPMAAPPCRRRAARDVAGRTRHDRQAHRV